METLGASLILDFIERVQQAITQFENFSGRLGPALDLEPSSLARWTPSVRIQQDSGWKGIGGVIIEILVSVPQTRQWWL